MRMVRVGGLLILLLMTGCASSVVSADRGVASEQFVGTTLCDVRSREFVGGLATNAPCHCVTWHLTFFTNQQTRLPSTFTLVAKYGLPGRSDPNQLEEGPTARVEGTWEIIHGSATNPRATVYRMRNRNGRTLSLVQLSKHLFHFLDSENRPMVGNAGWSYTLNRKGGL